MFSTTPIAGWSTNGIVRTVLIVGDTVYAGGDFTAVHGPGGTPTRRPRPPRRVGRPHRRAAHRILGRHERTRRVARQRRHQAVRRRRLHDHQGREQESPRGARPHDRERDQRLDRERVVARLRAARSGVAPLRRRRVRVARRRDARPDRRGLDEHRCHRHRVQPDVQRRGARHRDVARRQHRLRRGRLQRRRRGGARRTSRRSPRPPARSSRSRSSTRSPGAPLHGMDGLDISPDGDRLFGALTGNENRVEAWSTTTGQVQWYYQVDGDTQAVRYYNGNVYFGFHEGAIGDHTVRLLVADATTGALENSYRPPIDSFFGIWAIDADAPAPRARRRVHERQRRRHPGRRDPPAAVVRPGPARRARDADVTGRPGDHGVAQLGSGHRQRRGRRLPRAPQRRARSATRRRRASPTPVSRPTPT